MLYQINHKAIKPQKEYSLIDDTYKILTDKILGGGSFGHVFKCLNIKTNKEYEAEKKAYDAKKKAEPKKSVKK